MSDNYIPIPVKTRTKGDINVKMTDGMNDLAFTASGELKEYNSPAIKAALEAIKAADGAAAPADTLQVGGKDNAGNLQSMSVTTTGELKEFNSTAIKTAVEAMQGLIDAYAAADGSAAPSDTLQVGGKDSSGNLQAVKVDANGAVYVNTTPQIITPKTSNLLTAADLAAGTSTNLRTSGLTATGKLRKITISSAAPLKAIVRTVDATNTVITTHAVLFTPPGETYTYEQNGALSAAATEKFEVNLTNLDNGQGSDVYATFDWEE